MIWRQWECFLAVGKYLNYSKAAESLFLNQSVVSYHIRNLEDSMGLQLFIRSPHSVQFTPQGRVLYDRLSPLFREIDLVIDSYQQTPQTYELKISSTYIINYRLFEPTFSILCKHHPNVTITPVQSDRTHALDALSAGEIDACFAFAEEVMSEEGIQFYSLFPIRKNGYLIPLSDPLSGRQNISYHDLRGKTLILPKNLDTQPRLSHLRERITRMKDHVNIIWTNDMLSAYAMAAAGKGIALSMDVMPSSADGVTLAYNRDDPVSYAGICVHTSQSSFYARELASLFASEYERIE